MTFAFHAGLLSLVKDINSLPFSFPPFLRSPFALVEYFHSKPSNSQGHERGLFYLLNPLQLWNICIPSQIVSTSQERQRDLPNMRTPLPYLNSKQDCFHQSRTSNVATKTCVVHCPIGIFAFQVGLFPPLQ